MGNLKEGDSQDGDADRMGTTEAVRLWRRWARKPCEGGVWSSTWGRADGRTDGRTDRLVNEGGSSP